MYFKLVKSNMPDVWNFNKEPVMENGSKFALKDIRGFSYVKF